MTQNNDKKTQNALQFFGFRYPPFADTFEITKPYRSDPENLMVDRIDALIRQGKSLAICGEAGMGKSMFIKTITSLLDSKEFRIAQIPYGGMNPSSILRDLCDEFDIDTSGRKNLLSRINADFARSQDKPFPVIIIDEAHEMQRQSFIDLCSLLHDTKKRTVAAALILVGQPVLRKMLELDIFAPVRTRLSFIFSMPKLSIDNAREFIAYRLEIAKVQGKLFNDDAISCLATDSKGNRRTLMNLATLCLEEAARRKDKVITAEIVTSVALEYQF
jgi:type II secretory pathway predicted ATPase ExeA